ncbi:hypothetical protein [Chitinilyticum piscinae]|uniref:Uncharacterized protein n=1 Tax=Chitinilyticum piscinae TaxID=2866724 RepID=A0A8J7K9C1_9NEIS|nr:hypothetical protein [Chitinilyticum piscinae]MBE9607864.1 hypothetical protein [Chitinilyticum piscinae]
MEIKMHIQKINEDNYVAVMAENREGQAGDEDIRFIYSKKYARQHIGQTIDAGSQIIYSTKYAGQHIVIVGPLPNSEYVLISEGPCKLPISMSC